MSTRASSPRVRAVELLDLADVRRVLVDTWHHTYDAIYGVERVTEITDSWHSLASLRAEVDRTPHAFLLVEVDGTAVATGSATRAGDVTTIERLYVHPQCQRAGIGTALLETLVEQVGPAARIELEVQAANARAIAFYEQRGFAIVGRRDDHRVMRRVRG